jgi:hypothetical protein
MIVDQRVIDSVVNQPLDVSIPTSLIVLGLFSLMAGFYLATQIWKDYSDHSQPPTLSQ